ncbi:MAG: hypothetical protein HYU53_06185 [Acidobacteria bacterium]|nr:hypothetical protein [Acidobacteriota bacterium]
MIIARERYLDETSNFHLTLSLVTRTGVMHSLLSNVPDEERAAISEILVRALNEIEQRLKAHLPLNPEP